MASLTKANDSKTCQIRQLVRITKEDIARKLRTKKSAISRIENHAEDISLSTLEKYAKASGEKAKGGTLGLISSVPPKRKGENSPKTFLSPVLFTNYLYSSDFSGL